MKNYINISTYVLLPTILLIATFNLSCKKEKQSKNIELANASIAFIQSNIKGVWRLQYEKGGFCSTCKYDFSGSNYVWEFTSNNSIRQTFKGQLKTDTVINWIKDPSAYPTNQPATVMNFNDKLGYPYHYIIDKIYNDTLKLHDAYVSDATSYYLIRN